MKVRGYEICVGDKLGTYDNTYESIVELEKQLNTHGIETRIGCNPESGVWSVAILGGVPNNKYDCNREEITEITEIIKKGVIYDAG